MVTIYVGNLQFQTSEEDLSSLFSQYGSVHNVKIIKDRETNRPRGFGFVDMEDAEAQSAIEALNGVEFGGRSLKVNEAKDRRSDRPMNSNGPRRFNNRRSF